jgi:hypothetical protein
VNSLITEAARAQKSAKMATSRIPQPDGTAGEDYNLQTAMRLGGDDRTYNAIRVSEITSGTATTRN